MYTHVFCPVGLFLPFFRESVTTGSGCIVAVGVSQGGSVLIFFLGRRGTWRIRGLFFRRTRSSAGPAGGDAGRHLPLARHGAGRRFFRFVPGGVFVVLVGRKGQLELYLVPCFVYSFCFCVISLFGEMRALR